MTERDDHRRSEAEQIRAEQSGVDVALDQHADHAAQFRDRFWLSLLLTVPVIAFSQMFADLLRNSVPDFPRRQLGLAHFGSHRVPVPGGSRSSRKPRM